MSVAGGRITASAGSNLIGVHAHDRNQEATCYVGNIDPQANEEIIWELCVQAGPVGECQQTDFEAVLGAALGVISAKHFAGAVAWCLFSWAVGARARSGRLPFGAERVPCTLRSVSPSLPTSSCRSGARS